MFVKVKLNFIVRFVDPAGMLTAWSAMEATTKGLSSTMLPNPRPGPMPPSVAFCTLLTSSNITFMVDATAVDGTWMAITLDVSPGRNVTVPDAAV